MVNQLHLSIKGGTFRQPAAIPLFLDTPHRFFCPKSHSKNAQKHRKIATLKRGVVGLGVTLLLLPLLLHRAAPTSPRPAPSEHSKNSRQGRGRFKPCELVPSPRPLPGSQVQVAAKWQCRLPAISRETRKLLLFPGDSNALSDGERDGSGTMEWMEREQTMNT